LGFENPVLRKKKRPTQRKSTKVCKQIRRRSMSKQTTPTMCSSATERRHDYDSARPGKTFRAPLLAINFADDLSKSAELESSSAKSTRSRGRAIAMPLTDKPRGHGSHTIASLSGKNQSSSIVEGITE